MLTAVIAFFAGVFLAPIVRPLLRPLLVEIVKAAVIASAEVRRLSSQVKEDLEDAAAQADTARRRAGAPPKTDVNQP
jgi:hypothetical protein